MKKIIFLVLSGAAGKPCKTLDGKTPLEYANKPVIDSLFKQSVNGLMHVVGLNIIPQRGVDTFSLLGYNPFNIPSRGVIEAVGGDLEYEDGMLAMSCTLALVNKYRVKLPKLSKEEGLEAERLINEGISLGAPFTFKYVWGNQGVLVVHSGLSDKVTNTHPGHIGSRLGAELIGRSSDLRLKECKALSSDGVRTATLINDFVEQSSEVLSNAGLSVNHMFVRGVGNSLPSLQPFNELNGFNMALITDDSIEFGITKLIGVDVIKPNDDLPELIIDSLDEYRGVYLSVKGVDKYGHLGDAQGKVRELERVDKELMKPLIESISLDKHVVCITSDHATPACFGAHSSDPVPYLITDGVRNKGVFCESGVSKSFIEGRQLIKKVISLSN